MSVSLAHALSCFVGIIFLLSPHCLPSFVLRVVGYFGDSTISWTYKESGGNAYLHTYMYTIEGRNMSVVNEMNVCSIFVIILMKEAV